MNTHDEDYELIKKISKGDSKSFESLVKKYQKQIYGYCRKILGDQNMAEDMAQETWIKVAKNAESYQPLVSVQAWIFRVARNLSIDELRKKNRWMALEDDDLQDIPSDQDSVIDLIHIFQSQKALNEAILSLSEIQKTALLMSVAEELSMAEIAKELNMSISAVKVLLFRARETLKKKMGEG